MPSRFRRTAGSILARNTSTFIASRDFHGDASLSTMNRYLHSKLDATALAAMNAAHGIET